MHNAPFVSVIVPVKNRPGPTRELVESYLAQTYTGPSELIIVGDVDDPTWRGVADLAAESSRIRKIRLIESDIVSDGRDANAKRNVGLEAARGDILVLTDSDVVLPPDWLATGTSLVLNSEHEIVAGGANSVTNESFLANYVDRNPVGAKTSRMDPPYVITTDNAGKGRYKQPVTANLFFTRKVYETVGGLDANFVTPYEDFPYADVMVWAGFSILCTCELDVFHSHRDKAMDLAKEYWLAGVGCADYVMRYGRSHLAKARTRQLIAVMTAIAAWVTLLVLAPGMTLVVTVVLAAVSSIAMAVKLRQLGAVWYLGITVFLSALFAGGMVRGFISRRLKPQRSTTILRVTENLVL